MNRQKTCKPKAKTWQVTIILSILFIIIGPSKAKQSQPILDFLTNNDYIKKTSKLTNYYMTQFQALETIKLDLPLLLAGVFCFISASISSAGGVGGGGLYIPILTIISKFDLKTASSFSAFMVTGGSIANVMCNMLSCTKCGLIDYDIAIFSQPCMLLGVSVGVVCNRFFPEWLITILFAVFLVCSTFKTCKNGVMYWKLESQRQQVILKVDKFTSSNLCQGGNLEDRLSVKLLSDNNRISPDECIINGNEVNKNNGDDVNVNGSVEAASNKKLKLPWFKLGVLVLIWVSFSSLYFLRGNRYGEGIVPMEPCGVGYWTLSLLQIPLALLFTAWILLRSRYSKVRAMNQQDIEDDIARSSQARNEHIFPVMALLAGTLGGLFGIGGGMLISPLLLNVGISPEVGQISMPLIFSLMLLVTAATCSFMVFFSSTMSAFQYLLLGMEQTEIAIVFCIICFIASILGLVVVQRAIRKYGRASLIVFSVGTVMALSAVLMTSFGTLNVWRDYQSGKNMGFRSPC